MVGKRLLTNIMLSRDSRYGVRLAPSFEFSSTGALRCRSFHMKLKQLGGSPIWHGLAEVPCCASQPASGNRSYTPRVVMLHDGLSAGSTKYVDVNTTVVKLLGGRSTHQ